MAKTGKYNQVIADAAYHVFRLPSLSSGNRTSRMERIQPSHAYRRIWLRWHDVQRVVSFTKHQSERRRQGAKFRLSDNARST